MTTYDEQRITRLGADVPEPRGDAPLELPAPPPVTAPAPVPAEHDVTPATAPAATRPGARRWIRHNGAGLLFFVGDAVAVGVAAAVSPSLSWVDALFVVLTGVTFVVGGYYRSRFTLSLLDDAPHLLGRAFVGGAVAALGAQIFSATFSLGDWQVALTFVAGLLLMRAATYHLVRSLRRGGHISHPTLIVGAGMVGQELAIAMNDDRRYGLAPVGFVDDSPLVTGAASALPVVGGTSDLAGLIRRFDVDEVVIAFTANSGEAMVRTIRTADRLHCEISVVPRLFELANRGRDTDEIHGMPLVRLRRATFRSATWPLKRLTDIALSGIALLILSPLLLLVAAILRLSDGPGVIFRQERVGLDGRSFELLKFRSLRPEDEAESQTRWNVKHDDRLSPMGRFIRRTSIDELPQLWNIVRGDMSLVGPRPERPYFVETFQEAFPRYGARHRVPCGLTGWAQIHGLRGDTSIEERARFDNYYIENWSLWLDLKIIMRTVGSMMKGSG